MELQVVDGSPLRYVLSLPPASVARGIPMPVLCFLHGYDEAAPVEIRAALTRHGPLRPGSWPGAVEQFIVVAPQLPVAGDLWRRYADAVDQLVTAVQREHGGDSARTYLTGFSFGGNGVFDLAIGRPDRWAALWAVDPTRVPTEPIARPVWLSVGAIARRGREAFVQALGLRSAGGPRPPAEGDRLYLDEGADHVGAATRAYADEQIYRWMLARRLPGPA